MANLYPDDLKSMEIEKTPVLRTVISRVSGKNNIFLLESDMIPNTPITGSVCPSDELVFGSTGSCVHAHGKYRYNRLFLGKTRFNRSLTLQFSGLARPAFLSGV